MKVLLYFSPARSHPLSHLAFSTRWLKEGLAPLDWTIKSLLTLQNCQPLFVRHVHPLFQCDGTGGVTRKGKSLVNVIRSLSCHVNEFQVVTFSKNGCHRNQPSNVILFVRNYPYIAKNFNKEVTLRKIHRKKIIHRKKYIFNLILNISFYDKILNFKFKSIQII